MSQREALLLSSRLARIIHEEFDDARITNIEARSVALDIAATLNQRANEALNKAIENDGYIISEHD